MSQPKKCTAINALLLLALALTGVSAGAAEAVNAGTVMHMSGPLLATRADGVSRILAQNSAVNPGETLVTQNNGYAQIKFSDGSLLILKPGTALSIDQYSYDAAKPEADKIAFTLQQGAVRSNAGLLGKRSKDRVTINTPGGTVGLENASAIVQYQPPSATAKADQAADVVAAADVAELAKRSFLFTATAALDASMTATRTDAPLPSAAPRLLVAQVSIPLPKGAPTVGAGQSAPLPPGLYVQVIDGLINVTNKGGAQNFAAGQFGFTPTPTQPPVIVPKNPAIQFTPPIAFNVPAPVSGSSTASKSNAVDCVVR
jgi:hypothetical protein